MDYIQFVLAPQMLNGLSLGVSVILMALGLTIIFGLLDVINMAHGEFYAVGAYTGLILLGTGLSFWAVIVLVPVLMIPLGLAVQRYVIRYAFGHDDRHTLSLLLTLGLSMIAAELLRMGFGPNTLRPETPIKGGVEMLGIFLPAYRAFLIAFGSLLIGALYLLVYRTNIGAIIRAAAYDRNMAASLGVPVERVYAATFALGVSLAGLSGVLLSPVFSVFPTMGHDFLVLAFTVVIVGGLGSIQGAVLAGLFLTQVQAVASLFMSPVWSDPIVFGIMVLALMVRPQGLFGRMGYA
jgi:branched-chain amino acid transport system permease protein